MDPIKTWFMESLPWIAISALIIAMVGVVIWRERATRGKSGKRSSLKTEINIITGVTLLLIIVTLVIALLQHNIAAMIEIGIIVLIYAFFRGR